MVNQGVTMMTTDRRFPKTVREVMTSAPMTVTPQTRFDELYELFARHDVGAFPVVSDDGVLLGLVTKLDLLRAFAREQANPKAADLPAEPASRLMRPGILSIEADNTATSALELMVETRLQSLPVVHRGPGAPVLVGMVSRGDLLRGLVAPAAAAH